MRPEQQTNNMFRFQNPEYFYLMGILPAMVLIYIWSAWRANRRSRLFGDKELVERMTKNRSRVRPHIKFGLLLLALAAIITALMKHTADSDGDFGGPRRYLTSVWVAR